MTASRFTILGFDLRVIAAIILAAAAIGAINNSLVDDDRQVPWLGEGLANSDQGEDDGLAEGFVEEDEDR